MSYVQELLPALPLIVFSGLAAIFDWRSRKIPNAFLLIGLAIALALSGATRGSEGLTGSVAGFAIGLLLFLPGFVLRFTGAGDVKLLAVLGAFSGPPVVFQVFVVTVLLGAGLVILLGVTHLAYAGSKAGGHIDRYRSMLNMLWATREFVYLPPHESSVLSRRLPLAPLMALAVLIVLLMGGNAA